MSAGRTSLAIALVALFFLASGPLAAACPLMMARPGHDAAASASGCGKTADCCCGRATTDRDPAAGGAETTRLCPVQANTQLRAPASGVQNNCHGGIEFIAAAVPTSPAPAPPSWLDRDELPPLDPALYLAAATGLRSPPTA